MSKELLDLLTGGSPLAMVLVAIISGARGDWLFKGSHVAIVAGKDREIAQKADELAKAEKRGDEWREIALRGTHISEEIVRGRVSP